MIHEEVPQADELAPRSEEPELHRAQDAGESKWPQGRDPGPTGVE